MTDQLIHHLADEVVQRLTARGETLATAESCTGGLISAAITDIPGASAVFTHGFVTYANEAKRDVLGVSQKLLEDVGAVSSAVAQAMARGALQVAGSDHAVAVTGIAGPGGGTPDKPVGLVYIATASKAGILWERRLFPPASRSVIRLLTAREAFRQILRSC